MYAAPKSRILAGMEVVSLEQGDLRRVFPEPSDPGAVLAAFREVDGRMRALAARFGVRAGRAGGGLEYLSEGGIPLIGVYGLVEVPELHLAFGVQLSVPTRCLWDVRQGPPWQVDAFVHATCRGEDAAERQCSYDDPAEAVRGLAAAAAWLHAPAVDDAMIPCCGCAQSADRRGR